MWVGSIPALPDLGQGQFRDIAVNCPSAAPKIPADLPPPARLVRGLQAVRRRGLAVWTDPVWGLLMRRMGMSDIKFHKTILQLRMMICYRTLPLAALLILNGI
jgi:hypothetical protein